MMRKNFGIGLAVLLVTSGALIGQEKKNTQESNVLSPEDFCNCAGYRTHNSRRTERAWRSS